jgi:hypothetical protein
MQNICLRLYLFSFSHSPFGALMEKAPSMWLVMWQLIQNQMTLNTNDLPYCEDLLGVFLPPIMEGPYIYRFHHTDNALIHGIKRLFRYGAMRKLPKQIFLITIMDKPQSAAKYNIALNSVTCYVQNYDNYEHIILYTSHVPACQHDDVNF